VEDWDLFEQYVEGRKAGDLLAEKHYQFVYNCCYMRLGNFSWAEDATQDTFRKLAVFKQFKRKAKFSTFLYSVATKTAIDYLRKEKIRSHEPLTPAVPSPIKEPSSYAEKKAIEQRLTTLPYNQLLLFIYKYYAEWPVKDIAETLKMNTYEVSKQLKQILEYLTKENL